MITIAAAIALSIVACQKPEIAAPSTTHTVKFVAAPLQTKTTATIDGNKVKFAWTEADENRFTIYEIVGENITSSDDVIGELGDDGKMLITASFDGDAVENASYQVVFNSKVDNAQIVDSSVDYDQNSDVMVSEVVSSPTSFDEGMLLRFERKIALAQATLKGMTGMSKLSEVLIESSNGEIIAADYVYASDAFSANTSTCITVAVDDEKTGGISPDSDGYFTFRFAVIPGTVEKMKMTVTALDSNGKEHVFKKEFGAPITFTQGNMVGFGVGGFAEELPGTAFLKVTSALNDWTGDYIFANEETSLALDGSLSVTDIVSSQHSNTKSVTISNDAIDLDEVTANVAFHVEKDGEHYKVRSYNGYNIGGKNSDDNGIQASKSVSYPNDFEVVNGEILVKSYNNVLRLNPTAINQKEPSIRYYKSSTYAKQGPLSLYKLNGKFSADFPTLSVADTEIASNTLNVSVPVASNRNWTAEITEGAEFVKNGALTVAAGSNDGAIEFSFAAINTSISATQVVKIHVVADTKEKNITVTHKALGAQLSLEKLEDSVEADATEYTVNVTSANFDWNILSFYIGDDEQTVSEANCVKNINSNYSGSVTVKFPSNVANPSATAARVIRVTIGYADIISKTIVITQDGDAPMQADGWIETAFSEITSEDVFVITSGGYALSSANGTSASPGAVKVTILGNAITSDVTEALKWTVSGNATDGYSFYAAGTTKALYSNTMAASSSNTNLRVGNPTSGTVRKVFEFATKDVNTTLKTKDSYTARYVNLYTDGSDWRGYTSNSTSTNLVFYVYHDSRTSQTLSFTPTEVTYDIYDHSSFVAPRLTGANTAVSYSSSDASVAEVDNEGNLTVKKVSGSEGITITATAAENATYKSAHAAYILKVIDSTPKTNLVAPSNLNWNEGTKTLSWTDTNTGNGTYGTNYKYQYSVNNGSSWSDATSSESAVLSITSTTTVKVKAFAITENTHITSSETSKECTITSRVQQSATFTMKNSGQSSPVTDNGVTFTWTSSNIVVGTNNASGFKASSNMTVTIPAGKKLVGIEKGNGNTWGSGAQIDVYAGNSSSGTKIVTITKDINTYEISSNNTGTTYYLANTTAKNAWINTLTIKYE